MLALSDGSARAQPGTAEGDDDDTADRVIEVRFTPTERAQIALWVERADGTFVRTLRLTEAVALRGIGNRPGALQMNSGFRWPYGRREGVLPVWGHRRASAPGAEPFPRVIFQDRRSEGYASRTSSDASPDSYFCLSFDRATTRRDALDAVTCASQFSSDKGRYMEQSDVDATYAEPFEVDGQNQMRPLSLTSVYPPRRDLDERKGDDHPDVSAFRDDTARVMPEIDAVTMATPAGQAPQRIQFTVPQDWPDGDYVAWLEVNTEGDYNDRFNDTNYPTPCEPEKPGCGAIWDVWARTYGYAYRGQPSVVYRVPFTISSEGRRFEVSDPEGYGSIHGDTGDVTQMDDTITNDPTIAGSGADRIIAAPGEARLTLQVSSCERNAPPPNAPENLVVEPHPNSKESHRWATVSFVAPAAGPAAEPLNAITRYDLRYRNKPIVTDEDFDAALQAKQAATEQMALEIPIDAEPGQTINVEVGQLDPQTRFYFALRAVDACNRASDLATAEVETTEIEFTTVPPFPWCAVQSVGARRGGSDAAAGLAAGLLAWLWMRRRR